MSDPDANREVVRTFIGALRDGDPAIAAAQFDADRYWSNAFGAELAGTWDQMKTRYRDPAFADWEPIEEEYLADGDKVVLRTTTRARHVGPFLGVPATNRVISFSHIEVWRLAGGRIVEHWGGLREIERLYDQLKA